MLRIRNISRTVRSEAAAGVPLHGKSRVRVYTGDVAISTRPVVLEALLGSCVAVCLHDPRLGAGGMNHILLPGDRRDTRSTRFGVNAMELLINELMKKGADRRRLVAKAFGGANVLPGLRLATIGHDNAQFVLRFLAAEKIPLIAQRLGGTHPVRVSFGTDTGKASVRSVDGSQLPKLIHAEDSYWRAHLADGYVSGEVTMF
jgi:chemotaxis protein CheD